MNHAMTTARRSVVVLLMTLGPLAGCSTSPVTLTTVTIHGLLGGYEGGGGPPEPSTASGTKPWFVPLAGSVQAVQGSTVVATVNVAENGRFLLRLVPGTYRLEGIRSSGDFDKCGPSIIRPRARVAISVTILCSMPSIS
jgi:hypothetical protein